MTRHKQKKFAAVAARKNVIQPGKELFGQLKGNWNESYFRNGSPISLELACGRGEYTVGLSRKFPARNYIGIDLKGDRIWKGSGIAEQDGLENAAFLRIQIQQLHEHFEQDEVDEIWIVFPDPRPKDREEKRRLTHPRFLEMYKAILAPGGIIRLKTDNTGFFDYTLEILAERTDISELVYTRDLYDSDLRTECHEIVTRYEEKFHTRENKIKYLRFRFV